MALARNFQEVELLGDVKGTEADKVLLKTGGRIIGFTMDEQISMGIAWDDDIVRLRVAGTKDVRKLVKDGLTRVKLNEDKYSIQRKVEDVKPGFIDFYLKGQK